jgi:hypothetical protein
MKTYWGVKVYLHAFLTSALDGSEWLASLTGRFTPREEPPVPIGQEAGWASEVFWTRWWEKLPAPAGNQTLEPRSSGPYPSAIPTELSRLYNWIHTNPFIYINSATERSSGIESDTFRGFPQSLQVNVGTLKQAMAASFLTHHSQSAYHLTIYKQYSVKASLNNS